MPDGYEVIIAEIRRASAAADEAAGIAGRVDLAAAIGPVEGALVGSRAARSAGAVAPVWKDQVSRWSADARAYAGGLAASADLYEANEEQAARDLRAGAR